jgi:phage terminase large subunit
MTTFQILELPEDSQIEGYQPFGGANELWNCKNREVIIIGPSETGKTRGALEKLDALAWKYPGCQLAMVRKQYSDMPGSCIQTFEKKVLRDNLSDSGPITKYGSERPQFYDYPTGSRIWVGGLDKPGKTLSSERDFVYVNQAEELDLEDWEILTTRATGRAGNAPYTQIFGDANPSVCSHWMYEREREGKLTLIQSRHEDNPTLFNPDTGEITRQGKITLSILDGLTGVRYIRLREGKCANVEGMIYEEWDKDTHLIDPFPIPADWERIRVIDFGTVHPFVCGWWAIDGDGRMYLYRQIYMTGRTVTDHADDILRLSKGELIKATICDHDAGDRLTLQQKGIPNIPAKKEVMMGIDKVQARLKNQIDGKPRLFIFRNSLVEIDPSLKIAKKPYCTEMEFDTYIWANSAKEQPAKDDDHGMDMTRYAVMYKDAGLKGWARGSA